MKIYNKFVESKKEPSNKNDIWFDGSSWKMYKEGMWRSFTLPLDAAVEINKILQEDKSVLQQELKNYLKIQDSPFEKGSAENSVVLKGGDNKAINANEVALGKYNKSNFDTYFSVGIGTSNIDRKNAFEVKQNGDVYIKGIGGYNGTNPTESRDLRSVIEPIIIEWDSIKDYANGEGLNNMAELPWLDKTMSGEYQKYNWAIQKDGIVHPCVVIPDLDSNCIQMLFFTRNEIEGTTGPLGNAIMKYSGLRMTTGWNDIYGDEYYKAIEGQDKIEKIKEIVSQYYQYTQFKRACFECVEMTHNVETGRINGMKFQVQTKEVDGKTIVVFD